MGTGVLWDKMHVSVGVGHNPDHLRFLECLHLCVSICIVVCNVKEGNVLFKDALNTFYLRLYGVGHMVKDHF